jgi:hypothetical protein
VSAFIGIARYSIRRGRHPGDGKKAIGGREQDVIALPGTRFPTDAEWQILQVKVAHHLDNSLRSQINQCSVFYWMGAPQSQSIVNVNDVCRLIDKWQRQTEVLRNQIWKQPYQGPSPSNLQDQDQLSLLWHWNTIELLRDDPLSLLAAALDRTLILSRLVSLELKDSLPDINETLCWYLWVSYLIDTMKRNNVECAKSPSTIHKNARSREKYGIVPFIQEIQKTFLEQYQIRTTTASIQKGVKEALYVTRGIRAYTLTILLTRWMLGERLFFHPPVARSENEIAEALGNVRARLAALKTRRIRNRISTK